jgi:hypothetical protein
MAARTMSWLSDLEAAIAAGDVRTVSDEAHRREWEARRRRTAMIERATAERLASELSLDALQCAVDARSLGSGAVTPYADDERRIYAAALSIQRERRIAPARALLGLIAQAGRRRV